jgi:hypothetical protein
MRVSDVRVVPLGDACELQARVESDADPGGPAWFAPWVLWYRFPAWCEPFLSPDNGDPCLAALLPAAMATDATLVLPAPVSPMLRRATTEIQAIYHCFDPQLSPVAIEAPVRDRALSPVDTPTASGLFFSLGVDSFYSLLKNGRDHPDDEETITHLIAVHGFDAAYGPWDSTFPPALLDATGRVAGELGKTLVPVVTNLRLAGDPLASWNMAHGAGLASVALALEACFNGSGSRPRRPTTSSTRGAPTRSSTHSGRPNASGSSTTAASSAGSRRRSSSRTPRSRSRPCGSAPGTRPATTAGGASSACRP